MTEPTPPGPPRPPRDRSKRKPLAGEALARVRAQEKTRRAARTPEQVAHDREVDRARKRRVSEETLAKQAERKRWLRVWYVYLDLMDEMGIR